MTTNAVVRNALERAGKTVAKNGLAPEDAITQILNCGVKAKSDIGKLLQSACNRIDKYTSELSAIENKTDGNHGDKDFEEVRNYVGNFTGHAMEAFKLLEKARVRLGIR
jgi:hypothetical protein